MRPELRAGAAYAAAMFGLGALLGLLRELVLAPRLGATAAAAIEAVPMLLGMAILAPLIAGRLAVPPALPARLGMGAAGLLLLILAESALDVLVRGQTLWLERMRSPAGWIGLGLLAAFAAMPALRPR
ncbi:hypothetical protein [Belnapia rosea]|uniref:Uncharacterized protein n=1 Tax=Belnapia rosea TaxID=938405 RepID=A0A1G6MHM6_9PROT|nr:hypothetical protein [Belnapia rosea]SDB70303.1 hypothetical protein SAMN02927895_03727 [Belnapia rosea]SDC54990.1 hypothetical protein SAMN04487779_10011224 [Belnapia rosea]